MHCCVSPDESNLARLLYRNKNSSDSRELYARKKIHIRIYSKVYIDQDILEIIHVYLTSTEHITPYYPISLSCCFFWVYAKEKIEKLGAALFKAKNGT